MPFFHPDDARLVISGALIWILGSTAAAALNDASDTRLSRHHKNHKLAGAMIVAIIILIFILALTTIVPAVGGQCRDPSICDDCKRQNYTDVYGIPP